MDDPTSLKGRLADAWQTAARDFAAAGVPADAIYGTLLATGVAGLVNAHGKRGVAQILLQLAETIDRDASEEAAAIRKAAAEALVATRN